jgi:hypothetical protein
VRFTRGWVNYLISLVACGGWRVAPTGLGWPQSCLRCRGWMRVQESPSRSRGPACCTACAVREVDDVANHRNRIRNVGPGCVGTTCRSMSRSLRTLHQSPRREDLAAEGPARSEERARAAPVNGAAAAGARTAAADTEAIALVGGLLRTRRRRCALVGAEASASDATAKENARRSDVVAGPTGGEGARVLRLPSGLVSCCAVITSRHLQLSHVAAFALSGLHVPGGALTIH